MTDQVKAKAVNMEDMQSFAKVLFNKGIGNRGVCTTAAATAAKEVTLGTTFSLVDGATVLIRFTYGISVANATLAVTYGASGSQSTTAAKPIYYRGAALAAGAVKAGDTLMLKYENSSNNRWVVVGTLGSDYPAFGASGTNHASGLVPDPGATQGSNKLLCENATWQEQATEDDVDDLELPEGTLDPDDWESYFSQKADKRTTVTNVAYDGTNKKITKTINGVTTDVVTLDTMKTDMGITFSGSYNDLTDKPESLPANGGNSATVNNHTVNADVPADAVFTDTTYSTMGASGSGHAGGLVPDTPSTAGTTKFLREDGTWQAPDYPTTLPASDVSAWAKESTKPTYIMSEVSSISVVPISSNTTSSCSITGSGNAGKAQTIIYTNSSATTARTVTVPTTYKTPDGQAITLNCPAGGYCEVSYLNINGTVYARGV